MKDTEGSQTSCLAGELAKRTTVLVAEVTGPGRRVAG